MYLMRVRNCYLYDRKKISVTHSQVIIKIPSVSKLKRLNTSAESTSSLWYGNKLEHSQVSGKSRENL